MTGIPSSSDESPARGAEPSEALAALPEHVAGRAGGGAAGGGAAGSLAFPGPALATRTRFALDTMLDEGASALDTTLDEGASDARHNASAASLRFAAAGGASAAAAAAAVCSAGAAAVVGAAAAAG